MRSTSTGERYLLCPSLEGAGLPHAFTLRPSAGASDPVPGIPPEAVLEQIGLRPYGVTRPKQVHGSAVARPGAPGEGTVPAEADAVVVCGSAGAGAVATADCIGAILFSPGDRALAVIHAGWRGTLAGVTTSAIRALAAESGRPTFGMIMAMGPSIGPCCYEVGEDVVEAFRQVLPGWLRPRAFPARGNRAHLDLVEVNRAQARAEGLQDERIHASGICTHCRADICWSYRREGRLAGRMWTLAGLPGPGPEGSPSKRD